MKLQLTPALKQKLRAQLASILWDVILDGAINAPEDVASSLELLASEIRSQNPGSPAVMPPFTPPTLL